MKNNDRFICIEKQGTAKSVEVWVDTQTGVNYMFLHQGFAAGLSPLLDADGKPVVSTEYIRR